MKINNPSLEKIEASFGQSFTLTKFDLEKENSIPFWHFHPELEIAFIANGNGKRHVGNHISYYQGGDLIMLGPNLPHFGFTDGLTRSKSEIVVQLKPDFLGSSFLTAPEMEQIQLLFEKSKAGLSFGGNIKDEIGERLEDLFYMTPFEKLMGVLKILQKLAKSNEYRVLNASAVNLIVKQQDSKRIDTIYKHVRGHFLDAEIPLTDVAALINMTVPSFCRYFKRITNKTFTQFVNEFRVVHATKLLAETDEPISNVCYDSGFNNFSHFNRHFKRITGKSPSQYRNELEPVSLL